jgi:hypothetical protein
MKISFFAYIHCEPDPTYPGEHIFVPRDHEGKQVALHSTDRDEAHDNANDAGYLHTEDA